MTQRNTTTPRANGKAKGEGRAKGSAPTRTPEGSAPGVAGSRPKVPRDRGPATFDVDDATIPEPFLTAREGAPTPTPRRGPSKKAIKRRKKLGLPIDQPLPNPGRFTKGDPRINREGSSIYNFTQLRKAAQGILNEEVMDNHHPERGVLTRSQHIILDLIESNDNRDKAKALEIGHGKVPDEIHQYNFDIDKLMAKIDMTKLTNQQLADLASGKNIVEVVLADYLG
jgi:hypothetical protein